MIRSNGPVSCARTATVIAVTVNSHGANAGARTLENAVQPLAAGLR